MQSMKRRKQPPGYCTQCKTTYPADDMSHHSGLCWRCCPVPCARIETKQLPRVPGSKL